MCWKLVWAVILVTMSTSAEASSGVYFVPEDPINPVYNSWLVTVSVNLQPYIGHLGSLHGEVIAKIAKVKRQRKFTSRCN